MVVGSAGFAATVTFDRPGGTFGANATQLDLSSFKAGSQTGRVLKTNIGTFTSSGTCGGGGSVVGDSCSMQVRDEATFGRTSIPHLDSNDLHTISWQLPKNTGRARIDFQDLADRPGSTFTLRSGSSYAQIVGRQANGARNSAWLTFAPGDDREVYLMMRNTTVGFDGYAIESATIAPIPLPPAAALLVSGVLAMTGLRRRRKHAAA
jgi:hypothetical protein